MVCFSVLMTPLEGVLVPSYLVIQTQVHRALRILTTSHVIPSVRHVNNIYRGKKITLEGNEFQLKYKARVYSGLLKAG